MPSFTPFVVGALLAVAAVEAHVRGLACPGCTVPSRTQTNAASNGRFSTAGPTGGNNQFGNPHLTKVQEGTEMTVKYAYNGGHKSETQNQLKVRYACGGAAALSNDLKALVGGGTCGDGCKELTVNDIVSVDGQPASSNNYPVQAGNSNRNGYEIKFKVPPPMGNGAGAQCSVVVLDGRSWGVTYDVEIVPAAAAQPPAPPVPTLAGKLLSGTYVFTANNKKEDSPNCKQLEGKVTVIHAMGASTAKIQFHVTNFPTHTVDMKNDVPGALSLEYLLSNCNMDTKDQLLDINLTPVDGQAKLTVAVIDDEPVFCGAEVFIAPVQAQVEPENLITKCAGCQDKPGWKDELLIGGQYGTCKNYEKAPEPEKGLLAGSCYAGNWRAKRTEYYQKFVVAAANPTALDACCSCGGGNTGTGGSTRPDPISNPNPNPDPRVSSDARANCVAAISLLLASWLM